MVANVEQGKTLGSNSSRNGCSVDWLMKATGLVSEAVSLRVKFAQTQPFPGASLEYSFPLRSLSCNTLIDVFSICNSEFMIN